jgi:hypothetical protein
MMRIFFLVLLSATFCFRPLPAQEFSALAGSPYGGAINTFSQPAAGAVMPYHWDLEVVGASGFWNNNIFSFSPTRWNWRQDTLGPHGHFIRGDKKRWAAVRGDVHLVNFLIRPPVAPLWVFGAGWNLHSASWPGGLQFAYADSMRSTAGFLEANAFNKLQHGTLVDQQWNEWYVTASRIMSDNSLGRFTAGGTLKLVKGISAVVVDLDRLSVGFDNQTSKELVFTSAAGRFGYSGNLADLEDAAGFSDAVGSLLNGSPFSPALDVGVTYTRKRQSLIHGFSSEDPVDYDWKLEASLTDIGRAKYPLGDLSSVVIGPQGTPGVERFTRMMDSVGTLAELKDSLAQVAVLKPWTGAVSVSLPTALRINFDKSFPSHFYLNAQLALDMSFLVPGVDYRIHQLSYLELTPRWEIRRLGVYAPLYVNTHGSVMTGAALRLGPLVAGVNGFRWMFHAAAAGGAYVGLVIHGRYNRKNECPVF